MIKKVIIVLFILATTTVAQFKGEGNSISIEDGITNSAQSSFFTEFLDPNKFQMSHTIGMSYSTFAGNSVALSTYTNSMAYRFSENLMVEVDASLVASPYSSFGSEHQKSINGIYLSRAQLSYAPTKNTILSIQFIQPPPGSYYYGGFMGGYSLMSNRFRRGF